MTDYYLEGSRILGQKNGSNVQWYHYDSDGTRLAMEYQGEVYYYYYNAQGDVLGLFDKTGAKVVEYVYDSWGKMMSVSGSLANTLGQANPFRYRGYYYDIESGLYYLNSRYYDPETGRFLNADEGIYGDVLGSNLFIYCGNNPVMHSDPGGKGFTAAMFFGMIFFAAVVSPSIVAVAIPYTEEFGTAMSNLINTVAVGVQSLAQSIAKDYESIGAKSKAKAKAKEEVKEKPIVKNPIKKFPPIFPKNPYNFHPKGLKMVERSGTKNGKIIQWTKHNVPVFEWDEDLKNGSHYHVGFVLHDGIHYYPGSPVPEPYASRYF